MATHENQAGPEAVPPSEPSRAASDRPKPSAAEVASLRLARIQQYLLASLEQVDPLEANLGAAASDLMSLGFKLKQAIEESLADTPNSLERFQRLRPAIDDYLKLSRQIDRYAQLDRRLLAARAPRDKRLRSTGSSITSARAAAKALGWFGGTSIPASFGTVSVTAPVRVLTTGSPRARASASTIP